MPPRSRTVALALLPALLAALALAAEWRGALSPTREWLGGTPWLLALDLALPPSLALACARRARRDLALLVALLAPACLAPLAVLYPWTLAPDHLWGIGHGGFGFFRTWLTKYPSWGPINLEVLLGILCVLGASFGPAVAAAHALTVRRFGAFAALSGLTLVAYVPVLVRLDLPLCALLVGAVRGASGVGLDALTIAGGAVMRATAIVSLALAAPMLLHARGTPPG